MTAVVLLGAPGSGKGTVAVHLATVLSFQPFSTGRRIREEMACPGSTFGAKARPYMDNGDFIPDALALELVDQTMSSGGARSRWAFDGFPRTAAQALSFDRLLGARAGRVVAALSLEASDHILRQRLAGRWNCPDCGHTFHREHRPPRSAGRCDDCGAVLIAREDDRGELAERRLAVYPQRSRGLADYYRADGRLVVIDAGLPIESVRRLAESAVRGRL
jgi:adenylate kinase